MNARILVIADYYLPGYKAGGTIKTLSTLVEALGDEYQFNIICTDRDLGDKKPYQNITSDDWQRVGKAQVRYISQKEKNPWFFRKLLNKTGYDLLYIDSFFSKCTRSVIILKKLNLITDAPTVLAPRGQFSKGALELKGFKKHSYILLARIIGLYKDVTWQASSEYEKKDIQNIFGETRNILIAADLPDISCNSTNEVTELSKECGAARVVFVSRISRKKNLDLALQILGSQKGIIEFHIYGPVEDEEYWKECKILIDLLPDNVNATYCDELQPDEVRDIFSQYHLFLFPTRGENFGHVILESLSAGCPVLISDKTPWRNLSEEKAGWDVPLGSIDDFQSALNDLVSMNKSEFTQWSTSARELAREYILNDEHKEAHRRLFQEGA